jgi:rubrerythrin
VPSGLGELAGKGLAAVKGQVGVARAALTEQAETHLRNAREELREEWVEIGLYTTIETFANEVGDKDTAKLAREIRRDEEKTASYLEKLIPQLVKEVVKNEIPRDQRAQSGRSRRSSSRKSSSSSRSRSTSSRSRSSSSSSSRKSSSSRSRSTSARKTARKAASGARRATKAAATGARSGAKAARTSARKSAAGSRGGSSNGRSRSGSRKTASSRS